METCMNRPRRSLIGALFPLSMLASLALVGCGDSELSDEAYGYIDLAPYFFDGASSGSPRSALPREIRPQKGWVGGVRAEYYDFGLVSVARKRTSSSTPDFAYVHPMYFMFDSAGNPLFAKPIYEKRTGVWHMRGGKDMLDPNPRTYAKPEDEARAKKVPYSVRLRATVKDPARAGSDDYQRPVIDVVNGDTSRYSGLWEVVEVTVPDGYEPDAIKNYETLQAGIESGKFKERRAKPPYDPAVINCPMVDHASEVWPSSLQYGIPRPSIEVWYRTKLGRCYLVNGWEALGDDSGNLYKANSDASRLNVFDVIGYTIGPKGSERTTVVAPVGKMWVPSVRLANQDPLQDSFDIRYGNENLTDAIPKRYAGDPPGYRPIRWMQDIRVPQDPPFEAGTFKEIGQVDLALAAARSSGPWTRNYPLIGRAIPCAADPQVCATTIDAALADPNSYDELGARVAENLGKQLRLECNEAPDPDLLVGDPPPGILGDDGLPASLDAARKILMVRREGGARCDVPAVGFGDFCSPGLSRCAVSSTDAPTWFDQTSDPPGAEKKVSLNAAGTGLIGGYSCHPNPTGYCYFRCDVDVSKGSETDFKTTITYKVGEAMKEKTESITLKADRRCGGLPGYQCVAPDDVKPTPSGRLRVCLRTCSSSDPDTLNTAKCQIPLDMSLNARVNGDVQQGMTCLSRQDQTACMWDPAFEPRDPNAIFTPLD